MALTDKLSAIGDAIRAKTGTTTTYTLDQMPAAIEGIVGAEGVQDLLCLTGDCANYFTANGRMKEIATEYQGQITTKNLRYGTNAFAQTEITLAPEINLLGSNSVDVSNMFSQCDYITNIPAINVSSSHSYSINMTNMFYQCRGLESTLRDINMPTKGTVNLTGMFENCWNIPAIGNITVGGSANMTGTFLHCSSVTNIGTITTNPTTMENTFVGCRKLTELPILQGSLGGSNAKGALTNCESLKTLRYPFNFTDQYKSNMPFDVTCFDNMTFRGCTGLEELTNLRIESLSYGGTNIFEGMFVNLPNLRELTFKCQKGASQNKNVYWANQYIDLARQIGFTNEIADSVYANYPFPSNYSHDAAVRTINSLPNTTSGLDFYGGGTNTIRFRSKAAQFDSNYQYIEGSAIDELTEEEIAIATSKGWTIAFTNMNIDDNGEVIF